MTAAITQSKYAKGRVGIPYPSYAGHVVTKRFEHTVATTEIDEIGDIIEMAPIPPGFRVVDIVLDVDDLDSHVSPALTLDVGIMSGEWGDTTQNRTCGKEFFDAATTAQAGGVARPTAKTAYRTGVSSTARSIGIKAAAAAATAQSGTIGLTVSYASE